MKTLQLALMAALAYAIAHAEKPKPDSKSYGTVIGIDLGTTYSW